jgi:hypothetical protein
MLHDLKANQLDDCEKRGRIEIASIRKFKKYISYNSTG